MQLTENTPAQWETVIADLTAKRQSTLQHLEQLRAERKTLALDASLGDEAATKRLKTLNADINRLALEVDQFDTALAEAASGKRKAQAAADVEAELARQAQIGQHLQKYYVEVEKIDDGLRQLAEHFTQAKRHLDVAENLMNAAERTPTQQLRSLWGPTLAAAHFGLGEFVGLGQLAMHTAHRKPFADYAIGFIDRWVTTNGNGKESTYANGNSQSQD